MRLSDKVIRNIGLLAAIVSVVACSIFATFVFAFDNVATSTLTFTPGYRNITISWPAAGSAHLYVVYRADDATGKNAQRVGETENTNFKDIFLKPGSNYSYAVLSGATRDGIDTVDTSTLNWSPVQQVPVLGNGNASPHVGESSPAGNAKTCQECHIAFGANNNKFIVTSGKQNQSNQAVAICLDCHAKDSAAESTFTKSALAATFANATSKSGHVVDSTATDDGKLECTTCHGPHNDSSTDSGLEPSTMKKFGNLTEDITVDTTKANARCVTCHDDDDTWFTAFGKTYPSTSSPSVVASSDTTAAAAGYAGYPKAGTYPGSTVANSPMKNVHANIAASAGYEKGDCRYCHSAHGSTSPYSGLLSDRGELRAMKGTTTAQIEAERTSGAYASFCFSCHNGDNKGTPWAAAPDVKDVFSLPAGSFEASRTAFLASNAGHKVTVPGASIPQNSAIPCYECHNVHGSATNDHNFADTRGKNLTDANGKNDICYTCHLTSDGKACVDGAQAYVAYADLPTSKKTVLGLDRNDTTNGMKLSDNPGHSEDSTQTCSDCHGSAHNPVTDSSACGASGKVCTDCHTGTYGEYTSAASYATVAQGSAAATRWANTSTPHLIPTYSTKMGPTFRPLDILTGISTVGSGVSSLTFNATQGVYCDGCHGWVSTDIGTESDGSGTKGKTSGATLRTAYNSYTPSNTDYIHATSTTSGAGGLCLSCHNKNLGAADVGANSSGTVNKLNELTDNSYNTSWHNYTATITRAAKSNGVNSKTYTKTYNANCTKCHNNANAIADPKNNTDKLQLDSHYVAGQRLLARFGVVSDISKPMLTDTSGNLFMHDGLWSKTCANCHDAGKPYVAHGGKRAGQCFSGCHHLAADVISMHSSTAFVTAHGTQAWLNTYNCSGCHKTPTAEVAIAAKDKDFNNKGMCFGCHTHKGEIQGDAGKSYTGMDWYGQQHMNTANASLGIKVDATTGLQYRSWALASGTVIGTQNFDDEGVFKDMYNLNTTGTVSSGDGTGGAADTAASTALYNAMETSGHQSNRPKSTWQSTAALKPHVLANTDSMRCAECHNTHSADSGAMGVSTEWPTTTKALAGSAAGVQMIPGVANTVYADKTTPASAIASDGSRLITLNDFWTRNSLVAKVKSDITAWLMTQNNPKTGANYTAAEAAIKYDEMDYNGITAAQITTAGDSATAAQWAKTVNLFCYRCHDETQMASKAHVGGYAGTHRTAALACVNCHVPTVHGAKMPYLLTDEGAITTALGGGGVLSGNLAMPAQQVFKWTKYTNNAGRGVAATSTNNSNVLATNAPAAKLYSINDTAIGATAVGAFKDRNSCAVDPSCHATQGRPTVTDQTGTGWHNWNNSNKNY